jgi:hypothetical protein
MEHWEADLKWYPHFDDVIPRASLHQLARSPPQVARNAFYPFIRYYDAWQPFRGRSSGKPARKSRPIRFASRRDAAIFSYYRTVLSERYEEELRREDIADVVLAYRKIKSQSGRGKSNIEFAKDAFDLIRTLGTCAVVALDISSFFEHLDHAQLLAKWCRLLGLAALPPDHAALFRALTRYAVVDRDELYLRLGLARYENDDGRQRLVYKFGHGEMPKKLCSNADFRKKVCGIGRNHRSLVQINRKSYGIPQGSPISDLLANIYMLDFDKAAKSYCANHGGQYFRYSDDLLLVIPGGTIDASDANAFVAAEVAKHGAKLAIKSTKTAMVTFQPCGAYQTFTHAGGNLGRSGLEYLGFRYDGKNIRLRDATLSRLYRKLSFALKAECRGMIRRYPDKDIEWLISNFDYSNFNQRYGRVEDFGADSDMRHWTFWTYARRASRAFGKRGLRIPLQLKNMRDVIRRRVEVELTRREMEPDCMAGDLN